MTSSALRRACRVARDAELFTVEELIERGTHGVHRIRIQFESHLLPGAAAAGSSDAPVSPANPADPSTDPSADPSAGSPSAAAAASTGADGGGIVATGATGAGVDGASGEVLTIVTDPYGSGNGHFDII